MVLARWQATIVDDAGNVQNAASVEVREETGGAPLAVVYSDRAGSTPISNPLTADADGFVAFHTVGGAYKITATKGSFSRQWRYVAIGTLAEQDSDNAALSSATLTNPSIDGYFDLSEIAEPTSPSAGAIRAYASAFGRAAYKDSGGVVRYLTQDVINVRDFGAVGDGSTDDSAAVQLAVDSVGADDICLYFPAGQYALSGSDSTLAFADKNVTICGDGKGLTRILCQHANAKISFTDSYNGQDDLLVQRFNMRDISMVKDITTTSGNGGVAVTATWSYTGVASTVDHAAFDHVNISGHGGSKFWHTALRVNDGGCIRITSCTWYNADTTTDKTGPCIQLVRSAASNITSYNITNSVFALWNTFLTLTHKAATQDGSIEGIYISNCEIFGVQVMFNDDNDNDPDHQINVVEVTGCHCGVSRRLAFWGWISGFHLTGNNIDLESGGDPSPGTLDFIVALQAALYWHVVGNRFVVLPPYTAPTCFLLPGDPNVTGIVVVANDFEGFTNVSALISGTATRTQAVAIWGPNILQSTGVYGPIGIISDEQNDSALGLVRDYTNVLRSTAAGIRSSNATKGIGYATGAGGTVTQATNKSTAVTLNKICGQITMNNASLAGGATVAFQVNNSVIESTDIVSLVVGNPVTANAYRCQVNRISSGNFVAQITNLTGGALTDAVVLNFVVHKAVNA